MGKYRNRLEIISDMLAVVSENNGAKKTQIMYQANLSYKLLRRYLREISDAGLVRAGDKGAYELTRKGKEFLERFATYFERRKSVEKRYDQIRDEATLLESTFFNTKASKAQRSRKDRGADDE